METEQFSSLWSLRLQSELELGMGGCLREGWSGTPSIWGCLGMLAALCLERAGLPRSLPALRGRCGGHLQFFHPPIASTEVQAFSTSRCKGNTPQVLSMTASTEKTENEPFPGHSRFPQSQGSGIGDDKPFSCPLWVLPTLWDTRVP